MLQDRGPHRRRSPARQRREKGSQHSEPLQGRQAYESETSASPKDSAIVPETVLFRLIRRWAPIR